MAQPPIKLRWLEAVRDQLIEDNPTNHVSVLALATILQMHADPDGTNIFPGQATMGRESGLRHSMTVRRALTYLKKVGLISHVKNRARGVREYRLTFPGEARQIANEYPSGRKSLSEDLPSDSHSDSHSPGHSVATTPGTPGTPLEELTKEKAGVLCINCEHADGHDDDCAHRPFEDSDSSSSCSPHEFRGPGTPSMCIHCSKTKGNIEAETGIPIDANGYPEEVSS